MDDANGAPIQALLLDDESLARLDVFVVALGESIDAIQDSEHAGRVEETAKLAADLASDAEDLGLPPLATAALRVAVSCGANDAARLHADIIELTNVVRRVRIGHRSAL